MRNGDFIKQFRQHRRGLSQQRLAEILKVRRETVLAWELGHRPVPTAVLLAIEAMTILDNQAVSDLIRKYRAKPNEQTANL